VLVYKFVLWGCLLCCCGWVLGWVGLWCFWGWCGWGRPQKKKKKQKKHRPQHQKKEMPDEEGSDHRRIFTNTKHHIWPNSLQFSHRPGNSGKVSIFWPIVATHCQHTSPPTTDDCTHQALLAHHRTLPSPAITMVAN